MATHIKMGDTQTLVKTVDPDTYEDMGLDIGEIYWPLQDAPVYMTVANDSETGSDSLVYIGSTILDGSEAPETGAPAVVSIPQGESRRYGPFRLSRAPYLYGYTATGGDITANVIFDMVVSQSSRGPDLALCWSQTIEIETEDQYVDLETAISASDLTLPASMIGAPLLLHIRCVDSDLYVLPNGDGTSTVSGLRIPAGAYATLGPYLLGDIPVALAAGNQVGTTFVVGVSAVISGG